MVELKPADAGQKRLVYYLSMEEWAAEHIDEICADAGQLRLSEPLEVNCEQSGAADCSIRTPLEDGVFFLWQVPPTVIFGRNQDMAAEVDVDYCRSHGIATWRRKSGGGCVYSDYGNIMLSFVRKGSDVTGVFRDCLDSLAACLRSLGIPAEVSGRNDIIVDGKKVSGNAFSFKPSHPATKMFPQRLYDVSIIHGTLLYDLDFSEMSKAITPSKAKLESKAVHSVDQRVLNLKSLLDERNIGIDALKSALISYFCQSEYVMTPEQERQVDEIEQSYLDPDFIKGSHIARGTASDAL